MPLARRLNAIYRALANSEERPLRILRLAARLLMPGYRFTWTQLGWWHDDRFNAYLDRFGERGGMNTYRRLTVAELLRLVYEVPGDTAECGVFTGAGSYLLASFAQSNPRQSRLHHMFDSFEGLSAPQAKDGDYWRRGDLTAGLDLVERNLKGLAGTRAYKGWIPARFGEVAEHRFCFVHVDVDLYEPTRDSIEFFYPRLNPGAILICDDYACTTCPGATAAIDEYLASRPEKMVRLCCGGGFLIKGSATAPALALG
jgi:O-methyltransferase